MQIKTSLINLRKQSPLVHAITNSVTSSRVADIILSTGARPMMSDFSMEAQEITKNSQALLINLGMLNEDKMKAIRLSLKTANENSIPVVLDPVGVASSKVRRDFANELLENYKFNVIRGNYNEINYLVNKVEFTGVDSQNEDENLKEKTFKDLAIKLNEKTKAVILISGKYEIIADSSKVFSIPGGNNLLRKITGAGDMETGIIASLLAKPLSSFKAATMAGIFLRQIASQCEKNKSINSQDIIIAMGKLDEFEGKATILESPYELKEGLVYGLDPGNNLLKIKNALKGGMNIYQIRDKEADDETLGKKVLKIRETMKDFPCLLVMNDNLKVAKKYDLAVHLGQEDELISTARKELGRNKIIGATAKNLKEAIIAENMGASYIGSGAFFKTQTKDDAQIISLEDLKDIIDGVTIPVYPIGGINLKNLSYFKEIKLSGVCMSSAIFSEDQNKIENIVKNIRKKLKK